ncbi:MAG: hypothetical protein ACLP1Y_16720 [Candidatus Acidiferrales bacterium]
MSATQGVKRTGSPQAVQKLQDDFYMVQVTLSEAPSADWKRVFYETQLAPPPDFPPRSVDISSTSLRFRSDAATVEQKIALVDRWIARANEKEASMSGRLDEEGKRRRDAHAREQLELAELTARWTKL